MFKFSGNFISQTALKGSEKTGLRASLCIVTQTQWQIM